MANLTGPITYCALTDADRVAHYMQLVGYGEAATSRIDALIPRVSGQVCDFLGLHGLRVARTEDYRVDQNSRTLSLDAKPVASVASVKYAESLAALADVDALDASAYNLVAHGGWIELTDRAPYAPTYYRVTYTGGMAPETSSGSGLPDIDALEATTLGAVVVEATTIQVAYLMQRTDSLGGNIVPPGGGDGGRTLYTGQYGWQKHAESLLAAHRRDA